MRRYSVRRRRGVPEAVRLAVDTHFPQEAREEVLAVLRAIDAEDAERSERLALAVVRLSDGDLALARVYAERALLDPETIVNRAECREAARARAADVSLAQKNERYAG